MRRRPLKPGDLSIDPDIALLVGAANRRRAELLSQCWLQSACLAASIGAGSLLIFGIARSIGHDLLFRG